MNLKTALVLLLVGALLACWLATRSRTVIYPISSADKETIPSSQTIPESRRQTNFSQGETPAQQPNSRMSVVAEILSWRDQQVAEIKRRTNGFETEADRREIAEIQRKADEEIKSLLSDGEAQALQVEKFKQTDLGKALVEHFNANPDELAAISDYERDLAEVIATPGGDLEGVQLRNLAELKKKFGDDRTKEFMNYRDPDYVEALGFVKRFGLRPEIAKELMKLRAENGKARLERIQRGKSGTDASISEASRLRVRDLLGAETAETYIREAKGAGWLR